MGSKFDVNNRGVSCYGFIMIKEEAMALYTAPCRG